MVTHSFFFQNVTKQNTLIIEELSDADDAQTKSPTSLALDGGLSHRDYAADQQGRVEHHDEGTPQALTAEHEQSLDSSPETSPVALAQQPAEVSHRIQMDSETTDGSQSREDSNHVVDVRSFLWISLRINQLEKIAVPC